MSSLFERTVWPETEIPEATKALLARFYGLADLKSPEAGPRMASEVFTSDAVIVNGGRTVSGSAAISKSREKAWDQIEKREHCILRVYSRDRAGIDLLLLGELKAGLKGGREISNEFCARAVVANSSSPDCARLSSYQVWADPTPMQEAISATKL